MSLLVGGAGLRRSKRSGVTGSFVPFAPAVDALTPAGRLRFAGRTGDVRPTRRARDDREPGHHPAARRRAAPAAGAAARRPAARPAAAVRAAAVPAAAVRPAAAGGAAVPAQ